jgi:hypothetical protein
VRVLERVCVCVDGSPPVDTPTGSCPVKPAHGAGGWRCEPTTTCCPSPSPANPGVGLLFRPAYSAAFRCTTPAKNAPAPKLFFPAHSTPRLAPGGQKIKSPNCTLKNMQSQVPFGARNTQKRPPFPNPMSLKGMIVLSLRKVGSLASAIWEAANEGWSPSWKKTTEITAHGRRRIASQFGHGRVFGTYYVLCRPTRTKEGRLFAGSSLALSGLIFGLH